MVVVVVVICCVDAASILLLVKSLDPKMKLSLCCHLISLKRIVWILVSQFGDKKH